MEHHENDQRMTETQTIIPISRNNTAPVTRLSVHDAPFKSDGVARVKVTKNGKAEWISIPIRAVEVEEVERMVGSLRPKIPTYRDKIDKRWQTVLDEANSEYQAQLAAFQNVFAKAWVLMAISVDVVDASDEVVWSADNSIHDLDKAVKALKDQGLVDNQLMTIFREVQALTDDAQEMRGQD